MIDHKNIISFMVSSFNILLGLITLNNVAILVGILSGLSVITYNVINSVLRVKEYKRNDVNRISK